MVEEGEGCVFVVAVAEQFGRGSDSAEVAAAEDEGGDVEAAVAEAFIAHGVNLTGRRCCTVFGFVGFGVFVVTGNVLVYRGSGWFVDFGRVSVCIT